MDRFVRLSGLLLVLLVAVQSVHGATCPGMMFYKWTKPHCQGPPLPVTRWDCASHPTNGCLNIDADYPYKSLFYGCNTNGDGVGEHSTIAYTGTNCNGTILTMNFESVGLCFEQFDNSLLAVCSENAPHPPIPAKAPVPIPGPERPSPKPCPHAHNVSSCPGKLSMLHYDDYYGCNGTPKKVYDTQYVENTCYYFIDDQLNPYNFAFSCANGYLQMNTYQSGCSGPAKSREVYPLTNGLSACNNKGLRYYCSS